ncbi:MAG: nickel pincer cofactor biosynthesis protein LarC, partial [Chloroflexota bacterium]|nr:nickel pincer cofactor biosynthesis protein LarC [Chloroflexota bacterium]
NVDLLRASLDALHLPGWSLETERVTRRGIAATLVRVNVQDETTERRLSDLLDVIAASGLNAQVRTASARILTRLTEVEARIHSQPLAQVHLHEIGGLDTIVDVVGAVVGLQLLSVGQVLVSPFPLARGHVETAHGVFPLPAPATLALLRDAPIVGVAGERETVTPTAAAILTALARGYGALPRMTLRAVGYGAGSRDDPTPNVTRVMLGETAHSSSASLPSTPLHFAQDGSAQDTALVESIVELETNIDDMNPQLYDHVMARLFDAGALDVALMPLQMKKNRPGTLLRVFAPVDRAAELRALVLNETTTLGVREQIVQRYALWREIVSIETEFGTLRAKIARRPDGGLTVMPEYDDCVRAARERGVPIQTVMDAVKAKTKTK